MPTTEPFPLRCLKAWNALQTGRTPHREVPLDGPAVLRHYRPERPNRRPVFLLYAMVNRPYVLDLLPGRSVVERLLQAGHDVFLLDWGRPGRAEADRSIDSYLDVTVRGAVEQALRLSRSRKLTLVGYCQGGTYAALFAALYPALVRRLLLMAAPLDFDRLGPLTTWARMAPSPAADGNVSGLALRCGFESLRPFDTASRYIQMWERGLLDEVDDGALEHFLAMEHWVNDVVDHPGRAFREFHERFYVANALLSGGAPVGRRTARLADVRCPVLLLVGKRDNLIPPESTLSVRDRFGTRDVRAIECDCGHIGLSVSSRAHREAWPEVIQWIRS